MSKIQWTGQTWNPVVGCSIKSPGCKHCYAMKEAYRFGFNKRLPQYHGLTKMTKAGPVWTGKLASSGAATWRRPLARRAPTTYFVNSMGDLFHEDMKLNWQVQAFAIMALAQRHTFQVLTKRGKEMAEFVPQAADMVFDEATKLAHHEGLDEPKLQWPLPNVHLGVSVERQEEANERIPHLLETPAAIRFASYEPALELVDFWHIREATGFTFNAFSRKEGIGYRGTALDWLIIGGESGRDARPFDIDWARSAIRQCQTAGGRVFMKQLGSNPYSDGRPMHASPKGKYGDPAQWPPELRVRELPTPHQGAPA